MRVSVWRPPSVRCESTARKGAPLIDEENEKIMWATALAVIATLVSLLAALGYLAFVSRRLDATLGALLQKQREERGRLQQELDRLRATAVPGC